MHRDIGSKGSDPYDAGYKNLPKNYYVLKNAKNVNSAMQRGLPSVAAKAERAG